MSSLLHDIQCCHRSNLTPGLLLNVKFRNRAVLKSNNPPKGLITILEILENVASSYSPRLTTVRETSRKNGNTNTTRCNGLASRCLYKMSLIPNAINNSILISSTRFYISLRVVSVMDRPTYGGV